MNYQQWGMDEVYFTFGIESADKKWTDERQDSAGHLAHAAEWCFQDDSGTPFTDRKINGYCGAEGLSVNHNSIGRVTRGTQHLVSRISVRVQAVFTRATLA